MPVAARPDRERAVWATTGRRRCQPTFNGGAAAELYNLRDDIGEQQNFIDQHPDIAERLRKMMEAFHQELRKNERPAGIAE